MTGIEQYLGDLGSALHVRGRARRRLLSECRDHLEDASVVHGIEEAIERFGSAADLAESFNVAFVARTAARATFTSIVGAIAMGASTLAVLNAADSRAHAVVVWAVVFFACAQTAGVSALLGALRAVAMRHRSTSSSEVALLCRRNMSALVFSFATLFAAAAAVPGHGSAWKVLVGPAVGLMATLYLVRARLLTRRLPTSAYRIVRSPVADLRAVVHRVGGVRGPNGFARSMGLLVPVIATAAVAAFLWDRFDHGTVRTSFTAAGIEATVTILGFLLLGPLLGLWSTRSGSQGDVTA